VKHFIDIYEEISDLQRDIVIEAKDKEQSVMAIQRALQERVLEAN
jgi:hypothetical protein